ncbi:MarR family winged helix-turn-helix transcriptional regulator [Streptacidiphilus rugosus]|uniref:MarR family winged helix-turn-helix transcriptional regulator n=1 Tax=Streptacidiphilus rugosus TaxID=405783 RepID=UPI00069106F7|nr:MarR family transcriptional regulator [Streptacidiphilus rugosus]
MRTAEELRYLILAIQREGNKQLAADLRPLGVTPSQAEVLRVLGDRQPLTLSGLGELLVCETTASPSRLVDRLVAQDLVRRDTDPADRRYVTLSLTTEGRALERRIVEVEARLYDSLDHLTADQPTQQGLDLLRSIARAFPAGEALARRISPPPTGTSGADAG